MGLFRSRGKHAQKAKKDAGRIAASDASVVEDVLDEADGAVIDEPDAAVDDVVADEAVDETLADDAVDGDAAADDSDSGSDEEAEAESDDAQSDEPASDQDEDADEPAEGDASAGAAVAEFGEIPVKKNHRGLKVFGVIMSVLLAVALVAYVVGAIVFMGRFLPNTTISGKDVSLKTDAEVVEVLDEIVSDYRLEVVGSGFSYRMTGKDVGLSIDADAVVKAMHADLNAWKWPLFIAQGSHDETDQLEVSYKRTAFESSLVDAIEKYNEKAKAPVNATIVYEQKNDKFVVKPEEAGTKLDELAVIKAVDQALENLDPKVSLGDEQLIQPTVFSTDEQLIEAAELATGMVSAKLTLMLGDQPAVEVNGESLSAFVHMDGRFGVTFNEEEMNAWVRDLAAGFNTIGSERTYTRADGKEITVSGGVYGWEIDTDALEDAIIEGIKVGTTAKIEVPCTETGTAYNGAHQRDWGNRYIDVDISEQYVRFYGDTGAIIWEADCISGTPDGKHDTVEGVWTVNGKESPSKLIGYENGKKIYETSVKYWMPFEGNGIGFHDATWQPSFGGRMYANGYGSHGCVNLSYDDAQALYSIIEEGDVVVVHF